MIRTWIKWRAIAFALSLCGVTNVAYGQVADEFPYDLPSSMAAYNEVLPAGQDTCRRLGLDPQIVGRCNTIAVLASSFQQTDRSLWFFMSTGRSGPGSSCPDAVAFNRSKTDDYIEYLCRAPEEDVTIRPDEIAALEGEVARLNAVPQKTLAEHGRSLELKVEIDCATGRQVIDCN